MPKLSKTSIFLIITGIIIFLFMAINYFSSDFGKNYVNKSGSLEVYYIDKNKFEFAFALNQLLKNGGLINDSFNKDSVINFNTPFKLNNANKEFTFSIRIAGSDEYKQWYIKEFNSTSTLDLKSNQTILEIFSYSVSNEKEKEEIKNIIKNKLVDPISSITIKDPVSNYDLIYESEESPWIIAIKIPDK